MKTAFAITLFAVLERQEELPRRQAPAAFQTKTDSLLNETGKAITWIKQQQQSSKQSPAKTTTWVCVLFHKAW